MFIGVSRVFPVGRRRSTTLIQPWADSRGKFIRSVKSVKRLGSDAARDVDPLP